MHLAIFAVATFVESAVARGDALSAASTLTWEIVLASTVLAWVRLRHRAGPEAVGLRRPEGDDIAYGVAGGLTGVVTSLIVVAVVLAVLRLAGADVEAPDQLDLERPGPAILGVTAVTVVVVAPLAEEIFFRGFLFRALRRSLAFWPAAAVSSAIFAVTHLIPVIMPSIFLLGLILAWLVERRGGLAAAVAAHAFFNLVNFALLLATR